MSSRQWMIVDRSKGLAAVIVIAFAVSCGFLISAEAYSRWLPLIMIAVAGTAAMTFQARHQLPGLVALILAGVAFPIEIGSGSLTSVNAAVLMTAFLCLSWLLELAISPGGSRIGLSRVVVADLALMIVVLISYASGQFPWFPSQGAPWRAQLAGVGLFLLSGGLFLAAAHQIQYLSHLKQLTWLFLAAGGAFCISQVVPGLSPYCRWSSPDSVGSIFWIWLVSLSCGQALFNERLSKTARMIMFSITALALYRGIFLAPSWASGWLPPLAAVGVILSFRFKRTVLGLCALALPGGLLLAGKAADLLMSHEQYSYMTRLEAWRVLLHMVSKSPVLGLGPANYYYYTLMYPILGWYVHFSSHNNYVDLLAQTGILGLLAFTWFIVEIARITIRLYSHGPSGFCKAYAIGVLGGLGGSLVSGMLADWIIPFVYNIGLRGFRSSFLFWFFLGGTLALERILTTQNQAKNTMYAPVLGNNLGVSVGVR
jgi:hypothetical protein